MDELKSYVWNYFRWLQEITGCHIEEEIERKETRFRLTADTYEARKCLTGILSSLNTQRYELAFIRCDALLRQWYEGLRICMGEESNAEDFRLIGKQFLQASDYVLRFLEFKKEYYPKLMDEYRSTGLLGGEKDDVTIENVGQLACELETLTIESEATKYLRVYTLHKGMEPIDLHAEFTIRGAFVCCDNLDYLLTTCKPTDSDKVEVSMTLKIEPITDYSYFLLFLQYRDTCFVVTDSIEFANPHNAIASRNTRRRSESRERETGLPYRIIDDIIKWRGESTAISTDATSSGKQMELYVKSFSEYLSSAGRLNVIQIVKTMMKRIADGGGDFPEIGTFGRMLSSQKLLGTTIDLQSDSFKESFIKTNSEPLDEFFSEWVLPQPTDSKTTLPAPVVRDLAVVREYREDVLVTAAQAKSFADYYVAKRQADAIHSRMWEYYNKNWVAERWQLSRLIYDHWHNLIPYFFVADRVHFVDIQHDGAVDPFGTKYNCCYQVSMIVRGTKEERQQNIQFGGGFYAIKEEKRLQYKYNMRCNECGCKDSNKGLMVHFRHWKHIVALLGIDRFDLPQSWRNFATHDYKPYKGNSILDNVNPLYDLEDPASYRNPNGIHVAIPVCGNCIRKYARQYRIADKAVIMFDSKEMKIKEILDYEEWNQKQRHY